MEVSGQLHAPAALPPGKEPRYPLDRRLGGPKSCSGRGGEEKNSQPLLEIYNRYSSVDIVVDYGLDDRGFRVRFPAGARDSPLHHHVQNGCGAHLASCPMGTGGSFPESKVTGALIWPLTSIWCRSQRMRGAMPLLHQYAFMAWCLVKTQG
jgi:hypothetical protein